MSLHLWYFLSEKKLTKKQKVRFTFIMEYKVKHNFSQFNFTGTSKVLLEEKFSIPLVLHCIIYFQLVHTLLSVRFSVSSEFACGLYTELLWSPWNFLKVLNIIAPNIICGNIMSFVVVWMNIQRWTARYYDIIQCHAICGYIFYSNLLSAIWFWITVSDWVTKTHFTVRK